MLIINFAINNIIETLTRIRVWNRVFTYFTGKIKSIFNSKNHSTLTTDFGFYEPFREMDLD